MISRLQRVAGISVVILLVACIGLTQLGCGGSPFLAAQFASNFLPNRLGPPAGGGDGGDGDGGGAVLASICDVGAASRIINLSIQNQAQQRVRFAITFVVSAGPGGFVCEAETQNYLNAGYTDAFPPGSASSLTIGCDTVTLNTGTRILRLAFGVDQLPELFLNPNVGGDPTANLPTVQLARRDNGQANVPIPEIIVFGNSNPNFTCIGNDLCTQRGFNYASVNNLPIGKSPNALHIQGTVCNAQLGTAPEWRLDKTLNDNQVQPFQYPVGATIVVTVLDRSGDSLNDTRNQVVWTVTGVNSGMVQNPEQ